MDNDRDQLDETECLLFQQVSKILNIPKSAFYRCPAKKKKKEGGNGTEANSF